MTAGSELAVIRSTGARAQSVGRRVIRLWGTDGLVIISLLWLLIVAIMAVAPSLLTPYDPTQIDLTRRLLPPMATHGGDLYALGTDEIGRDYLSRIVIGARAAVVVGFVGAAVATGFALIVGSVAGYTGGRADAVVSRLIDAQLAFPTILIAILLLISVGPSTGAVIVVLAIGSWPGVARLVRSLALAIRRTAYIEAAMALDAGAPHIIRRHVIPNLITPVLVFGLIMVAQMMLASAGLDFLGLGIQPPETSWGSLIEAGRDNIQKAWWLITLPGLAIFFTVLAVNLVATKLRRETDPSGNVPSAGSSRFAAASNTGDLALPDNGWAPDMTADDPIGQASDSLVALPDAPGSGQPDLTLVAVVAEGSEPLIVPSTDPGRGVDTSGPSARIPVLAVDRLSVDFFGRSGVAHAVRGVSWAAYPGEVLAIVGESGSGKSVTAKTIMGILGPPGAVTGGRVLLKGQDLLSLSRRQGQAVYGRVLTMVPQDPVAALNPVISIGSQLEEVIRTHNAGLTRRETRKRALDLIDRVGIPDPASRFDQYPFQLSGGMCQRVLIAMAVANDPEILIADEPTTALDVSIQAQIMDLMMELQSAYRMSLVLITHDLGLVSERADRVIVMYAGKVMETGTIDDVIERSGNPYTQALLRARPEIGAGRSRLSLVPGIPPNATRLPVGCPFNPRCPMAVDLCRSEMPVPVELATGHTSTCHRAWEAYRA